MEKCIDDIAWKSEGNWIKFSGELRQKYPFAPPLYLEDETLSHHARLYSRPRLGVIAFFQPNKAEISTMQLTGKVRRVSYALYVQGQLGFVACYTSIFASIEESAEDALSFLHARYLLGEMP